MLEDTRIERPAQVEHVWKYAELSLTELLSRTDMEVGCAASDMEAGCQGTEGRLAMAEARHAELLARREELGRQSRRSRAKRSR